MVELVYLYSIFTIYYLYRRIEFRFIAKTNVVFRDNKVHLLYNHGYKTLYNGMKNTFWFMILYWLLIIISFSPDYFFLFYYFWLFYLYLSMCSFLYKISEIKHLADGISTNNKSHKFFIRYSLLGIIGLFFDIMIVFYLNYNIFVVLTLFLVCFITFILGMGDLLQVRRINVYGGSLKNLMELMFMFIDIPKNIKKAIWIEESRKKFKDTLIYNLTNIKKGFIIAFNIFFRKVQLKKG